MTTFDIENLGKQVFNLRKTLGLTQDAFAREIGFSRSYIKNIESGHAGPSSKILSAISSRFGISIDWIVFGYDLKRRVMHFLGSLDNDLRRSEPRADREISDDLEGLPVVGEREIAFYIQKILTAHAEIGRITRLLQIEFDGAPYRNWLIETNNKFYAFLGIIKKDHEQEKMPDKVISWAVLTTNTEYRWIKLPGWNPVLERRILRLREEDQQIIHIPSGRAYVPDVLFKDAEPSRPEHPYPSMEGREIDRVLREYFSPFVEASSYVDLDSDSALAFRSSKEEKALLKILRELSPDDRKDIHALVASKAGRLEKLKLKQLKRDIHLIQKSNE